MLRRVCRRSRLIPAAQSRSYVNVIMREPMKSLLPTSATERARTNSHTNEFENFTVDVDVDQVVSEIAGLSAALKGVNLADRVLGMPPLPYLDALFPADLVASYQDMLIPMPKYGFEHRASEISDILRFLKANGSPGDIVHVLQDTPGARANGGDFVNTPSGLVIGHGRDRPSTNTIAFDALAQRKVQVTDITSKASFPVFGVELPPEAPLLGDMLGFAGQRMLVIHDNPFAIAAAKAVQEQMTRVPWMVLKIEDGCPFLTHHGGLTVEDVVVDVDFPASIERLGEAGLHPYPLQWSESRKAGLTMRRLCLVARFAAGGFSGGIKMHRQRSRGPHVTTVGSLKKRRDSNAFGDVGAPLEAQIRSTENLKPVRQPAPRYRPPMHQRGQLQVHGQGPVGSAPGPQHPTTGAEIHNTRYDPTLRAYYDTETNLPYPQTQLDRTFHLHHEDRLGSQPLDPHETERFK